MKRATIFLLILAILMAPAVQAFPVAAQASFDCADVTEISLVECQALVALYNSTGGPNWQSDGSWLASNTPGSWSGVQVDSGHVYALYLESLGLSGSLPTEIGDFPSLVALFLKYNYELGGALPPELGNLTNLEFIALSGTKVSGSIPVELGNLSLLQTLDLRANQLTGSIPVELGNLSQLQTLDLSGNQLTGSIPVELGNLSQLQTLDLSGNQLTGSIRVELGNLSQLQTLRLDYNPLGGTIPTILGNLGSLRILGLSSAQLIGTIPSALGNLHSLTWLDMGFNQLTGAIPPDLGNLANLTYLCLWGNQFSGSIPSSLGNLANLRSLYISENQLSGPIPDSLGQLSSLENLWASSNQLGGSIPAILGNLQNLNSLLLGQNQLTGTIPPELGNLTRLESLSLATNHLEGSIPAELGNMRSLELINLWQNALSGPLPASLGNLTSLRSLRLEENQLTGMIPISFINLVNMETFGIGGSSLCEPVSEAFQAWKETVNFWGGNNIICSSTASITGLEVNQAIEWPGPYVAGKATAVRVFLDQPVLSDPANQQVAVFRNNALVTTLALKRNPKPTNTLEFVCPTLSACGNWAAGGYSFQALVGGAAESATAAFVEQRRLRILVVPVTLSSPSGDLTLKDDEWKTAYGFLKDTYPIAEDGLEWVIGNKLAVPLSLAEPVIAGLSYVFFPLQFRQPLLCGKLGRPACYDAIVGIMPPIGSCSADSCNEGKAGGKTALIFANGTYENNYNGEQTIVDNMQAILAHEVGHMFGLGDEYNIQGAKYQCDINPPPASYLDFRCPDSLSKPWPGPGSGSLVESSIIHPYEVGGRGLLGNSLSFMGSGVSQKYFWVTLDSYGSLYFSLIDQSTDRPTVSSSAVERVIEATGWIDRDGGVSFEPWYHAVTTAPPVVAGAYSIQALDSAGNVLASQNFDLEFSDWSNPPQELEQAPFRVALAFPSGTARFVIVHNDIELTSRAVPDAGMLSVELNAPNGGEHWDIGQTVEVSWQGSTDDLFYTLLYSPDGIDWLTLEANLNGSSYDVDTSELPGGQTVFIKVLATDGVNTVEDVSDTAFTVEPKPPLAQILYPADEQVIPQGTSVMFSGKGYDLEEGFLADENLAWYSDMDGELGAGQQLLVDELSPGAQTITLSVIDGDGKSAQSTIQIRIGVPTGSTIYLPMVTSP